MTVDFNQNPDLNIVICRRCDFPYNDREISQKDMKYLLDT